MPSKGFRNVPHLDIVLGCRVQYVVEGLEHRLIILTCTIMGLKITDTSVMNIYHESPSSSLLQLAQHPVGDNMGTQCMQNRPNIKV